MDTVHHDGVPLRNFREASLSALESLRERFGMAFWMVTRGEGESDPVVLQVRDSGLDLADPHVKKSLEFYCRVAASMGPKIEPAVDAASALAGTDTARRLKVGAFIGLPLKLDDGTVMGTLCAIDPEAQPESLRDGKPMFEMVAGMLAGMLDVESRLDDLARRVERAEARLVDDATGLYDSDGWARLLAAEDERCNRYNRPAGAMVIRIEGNGSTVPALNTAGGVLVDQTRGTDVVARIGPDRIGLLLLEARSDALSGIATRLDRELLAKGIAASIGFAVRDPDTGFAASVAAAERVH